VQRVAEGRAGGRSRSSALRGKVRPRPAPPRPTHPPTRASAHPPTNTNVGCANASGPRQERLTLEFHSPASARAAGSRRSGRSPLWRASSHARARGTLPSLTALTFAISNKSSLERSARHRPRPRPRARTSARAALHPPIFPGAWAPLHPPSPRRPRSREAALRAVARRRGRMTRGMQCRASGWRARARRSRRPGHAGATPTSGWWTGRTSMGGCASWRRTTRWGRGRRPAAAGCGAGERSVR